MDRKTLRDIASRVARLFGVLFLAVVFGFVCALYVQSRTRKPLTLEQRVSRMEGALRNHGERLARLERQPVAQERNGHEVLE